MVGESEQLYNAGSSYNACTEGLWLSARTSHAVSESSKTVVFEQTDPSIPLSNLLGQVGCEVLRGVKSREVNRAFTFPPIR